MNLKLKNKWTSLLTIVSMLAMVTSWVALPAQAASPPNIVTYQGRVLDSNGVPVSNSSVSMKFFLYSSLTGGTCIWSNSSSTCDGNTPGSTTARTVTLTSGLFTENLGDTAATTPYSAIADSTFADNSGIYLEVIIAGETLTPRKQLVSAPYAQNADTLDGIDLSVIQLWEVGTNGSYEDDAAAIVGANAAFSYGTGGVGDLRVADEIEVMGDGFIDNDLVVGASTSSTETIANIAFSLGGNDLFVASDAGIEGNLYIDGAIDLVGTATVGDLACTDCLDFAELSDTLALDVSTSITQDGAEVFTITNSGTGDTVFNLSSTGDFIIQDNGTPALTVNDSGNAILAGDLAVNGGDLTSTATTWNIDVGNTGSFVFRDGTNTLFSIADAGTTGNASITGTLGVTGAVTLTNDLAVNGDDITSDGNLTLSATGYTRVGDTGTPGDATADDALYVEGAFEVDGTAYFGGTVNASDFACTDCLDFAELSDTLALDASTTITQDTAEIFTISNTGTGATAIDLTSTGDLDIRDSSTSFFTFNDDRSIDYSTNQTTTDAFDFTADSISTANALDFSVDALTTGRGIYLTTTSGVATSADLMNASITGTHAITAHMVTGSVIDASRSLTVNDGTGAVIDLSITGPVVSITDNCLTPGNDTCTHTGPVFQVQQSYASATGPMIQVYSAGAGAAIALGGGGTGTAILIDSDTYITDINLQNGESISNNTNGSIDFGVSGSNELTITSTSLSPSYDSGLDLGTSLVQFADLYLDGGNINLDNATDIDIDDNTASVFTITEGATNYLNITTSNTLETMTIGSATLTRLTITTADSDVTDVTVTGSMAVSNDLTVTDDTGLNGDLNVTLDDGDTISMIGDGSATTTILNVAQTSLTADADALVIDLTQSDGMATGADNVGIDMVMTGNDADGDMLGIRIISSLTTNAGAGTYEAALSIINAEDTAGSMTDAILIVASGIDAGITDAIDVSDTEITNAINVGGNVILGGAAVINFDGFDVAATTGLTTIAGSADGIDALVLTLGDIYVTNGDLDVAGGDFNVTLDAGDGVNVSNTGATVDAFTISQTTTDAAGLDGLVVNLTAVNGADRTARGQVISVTSQGTAATDLATGLFVDLISTVGAMDTGISIGATAEWDIDLNFASTTAVMAFGAGGSLTFTDGTNTMMTLTDAGTTGNASITGTLGVTGVTTLTDDLAVNGDDITSDGNLTLSATGYTRVGDTGTPGDATADDALYVEGAFEVDGTAYFGGTVNASDFACTDCLDFAELSDTLALDVSTSITQDGAEVFTITNSGTGDTVFNLSSTGDFIIQDNGTPALTVNDSGNTVLAGDLAVNGGDLISSSATFNFLDAASNSLTIDIGGVTTDLANAINIATNGTSADTISVGNTNASTTLALNGGDDWTMSTGGALTIYPATFGTYLDFDLETEWVSGDLINVDFDGATTQTGRMRGLDIDFAGLTPDGTNAINGIHIDDPQSSGAQLTEYGIYIQGTNWDYGLYVEDLVSVGLGTTASVTAVCSSLATATPPSAGTSYELRDCDGGPIADYAEQYPVAVGISYGDIVVPGTQVVTTQDGQTIVQLMKSSTPYQGPVSGIVSNNYGDFTSAGYNIDDSDNPMPVALIGRVPVNVTNENGSIQVGDYLTTSSTPGFAMKATEVGRVIGMALADFSGANGQVMVQVNNGWYLGNVIGSDGSSTVVTDKAVMAPLGTASESQLSFDSYGFALRGSAWDGNEAKAVEMMLKASVTDQNNYRLSVRNTTDTEVAYITDKGTLQIAGDIIISGRLYPSDRGVAQTDKYIYYDGSEGAGGDFMRTNAKGWSTGSYDFAEMFPSNEILQPGEIVVLSGEGEKVRRSVEKDESGIVGIVSTRPGFLAGENSVGSYPIALSGRVPTFVTTENGEIKVGDPLTSSLKSGYAMKATKSGVIIGYALEPLTSGEGSILSYVNVGYWGGDETSSAPGANNSASELVVNSNINSTALNMSGNIYMTGNDILSIGRLVGISDVWEIMQDGTIKTEALLKTVIRSYTDEKVETIAVTSPEAIITLSGTSKLSGGTVEVRFESVSPEFNDVTSADAPIRVLVTPNGPVSLYVSEKDNNHFVVNAFGNQTTDVFFDWMVTAYRKGYEPEGEVTEVMEVAEVTGEGSQISEENVAEGFSLPEVAEVQEVEEPSIELIDPASPASPDETIVDQAVEVEGGEQAEVPTETLIENSSSTQGGE